MTEQINIYTKIGMLQMELQTFEDELRALRDYLGDQSKKYKYFRDLTDSVGGYFSTRVNPDVELPNPVGDLKAIARINELREYIEEARKEYLQLKEKAKEVCVQDILEGHFHTRDKNNLGDEQ